MVRRLLRSLWIRSNYAHKVMRSQIDGMHVAACTCGWTSLRHRSRQDLNEETANHAGWTL